MRLALALCLVVLPFAVRAEAISLRGQWQADVPADPTFSGVVLIDAQRRVTWDAGWDRARRTVATTGRARSRGYVQVGESTADIFLTNGVGVEHILCAIESSDLLHCYVILSEGRKSAMSVLTRVGPGPATLMPVPLSRSN